MYHILEFVFMWAFLGCLSIVFNKLLKVKLDKGFYFAFVLMVLTLSLSFMFALAAEEEKTNTTMLKNCNCAHESTTAIGK